MSEHPNEPNTPRTRKGRPTVDELRQRTLPLDRLWIIEDVAAFLTCSVRETEDIVKDPGVPQPRLSQGRIRRWTPIHWHTWMAAEDETYVANTAAGGDEEDDDDMPELGAA